MKMNKNYQDRLKASVRTNSSEWEARRSFCAKRILAAVCFRESSYLTLERTNSSILPSIGYYYSMFHIGAAALTVDYTTPLGSLKRGKLTHKLLESMISSKMITKKLLFSKFLEILRELKDIREFTNYSFKVLISLKSRLRKMYSPIGVCFDSVIDFIQKVSDIHDSVSNISLYGSMQGLIADGIGDDTFDTYLSDDEFYRVNDYLDAKDLMH